MWPLRNISFFESEKRMSVNVACQQLTGTGWDTLFCTRWARSTMVDKSQQSPAKSSTQGAPASQMASARVR
jgi:hypothetical protein